MARPKPIVIDGEYVNIGTAAKLADVVPAEVSSIVTHDGELISRADFARVPVPQGFQTNLSAINKGGLLFASETL